MGNTITLQIGGSLDLVLRSPEPQGGTIIHVFYEGFAASVKGSHMAYTLQAGKLIDVQISYVDKFQNPATVDGVVAWESSDPKVTVEVAPTDDTMCAISAPGAIGTAQVKATADADLGEGVRQIITLFDIEVVGGEAVAGAISVIGDPQDIAPHPEQQSP